MLKREPVVLKETQLIFIDYKYNTQKVPSLIITYDTGITKDCIPFLSN